MGVPDTQSKGTFRLSNLHLAPYHAVSVVVIIWQIQYGCQVVMTIYSELPLIRTPEMWPPLYSGHLKTPKVCFVEQIHP